MLINEISEIFSKLQRKPYSIHFTQTHESSIKTLDLQQSTKIDKTANEFEIMKEN